MKTVYFDVKNRSLIDKYVERGGVFVGTTDTVLGLYASLTYTGFLSLNTIKQRKNKPYLILVASKEKAAYFSSDFSRKDVAQLINHYWPGPVTLLVRAREYIPQYMQSAEGNIAIRLPDNESLRLFLSAYKGMFSTSANMTKKPIPSCKAQIDPAIAKQVKLFVFFGKQSTLLTSSALIDCTTTPFTCFRKGSLSDEAVKNLYHFQQRY